MASSLHRLLLGREASLLLVVDLLAQVLGREAGPARQKWLRVSEDLALLGHLLLSISQGNAPLRLAAPLRLRARRVGRPDIQRAAPSRRLDLLVALTQLLLRRRRHLPASRRRIRRRLYYHRRLWLDLLRLLPAHRCDTLVDQRGVLLFAVPAPKATLRELHRVRVEEVGNHLPVVLVLRERTHLAAVRAALPRLIFIYHFEAGLL